MRVLVACEFSGIVRRAFRACGHDAWSCDVLDCEDGSDFHLKCDVNKVLRNGWDLMVAHPPCTYLASSGARWFKDRPGEQIEAINFVKLLACAPIKKIAIENPIGVLSTLIRKPDQIIQPWQFGHGETKATCLWLTRLPTLIPSEIVSGREPRVHHEPPSPNRWRNRSRTYDGIAQAMATQWNYS